MIGGVSLENWALYILLLFINGRLFIFWDKQRQRRKREQFLRAVVVEYPDAKLTFIAVEDSDKEAMARLEQEIRTNRYHGPRP